MTPAELAAIHAACFTQPRPWSADEFADLLASPKCQLITAKHGFAFVQVIAPEAELLTIAVHPEAQRAGMGRRLLARAEASAKSQACKEMFLEVAETNTAAIALYNGAGFLQRGLRKNYYNGPNGRKSTALVLHKLL